MGANQSAGGTRSVSMDNPTPSGVIDVSDEVVQRLKLGISRAKQQEKEEVKKTVITPAVPATQPKKTTVTTPQPAAVRNPVTEPAALPKIIPNPVPVPQPSQSITAAAAITAYPRLEGEPVITAMEMRRQKEIELRENDKMWRTRISQLEGTLNKTNEVMEKEYSAAIENVRKRFTTGTGTHQLPPCQDLKTQLIACYRAYPNETLKCAEEVALFTNCVAVHRMKKLDTEQKTPAAKGA